MTFNAINLNPARVTQMQKATAFLQRTPQYRSIAALIATMRLIPDDKIPTACTDAVKFIKFNPDYIEGLPCTRSAAAVQVHEALHKFQMIHVRCHEWSKRHPNHDKRELMMTMNIAGDYLINHSIKHDWCLPIQDGWMYDVNYHMGRHTLESLSDELLAQKGQQGQGGQQGQSGDGDDTSEGSGSSGDESGDSPAPGSGGLEAGNDVAPPEQEGEGAGGKAGEGDGTQGQGGAAGMSDEQARDMESEIKKDLAQASRNSGGVGLDSADFFHDELGAKVKAPTASLKKEITRFASELNRSGHTSWMSPNRKRFLPNGFPMPGPRDVKVGTVIAVIDVSGSTSGEAAQYFLNTVVETFKSIPFKELIIIHHNTRVTKTLRFTDREVQQGKVPTTIQASGGTKFRPVFEWVRDNVRSKVTAMVYLTDGGTYHSDVMECMRLWQSKRYPLLWALWSNWSSVDTFINWVTVNAKFGRVCRLPQDKW